MGNLFILSHTGRFVHVSNVLFPVGKSSMLSWAGPCVERRQRQREEEGGTEEKQTYNRVCAECVCF